jgi:hypothetical protein
MNEQMNARPWLAHTRHDYAQFLLRHRPSTQQQAHELLQQALTSYRELGIRGSSTGHTAQTATWRMNARVCDPR